MLLYVKFQTHSISYLKLFEITGDHVQYGLLTSNFSTVNILTADFSTVNFLTADFFLISPRILPRILLRIVIFIFPPFLPIDVCR